jgi:hypothetical protein
MRTLLIGLLAIILLSLSGPLSTADAAPPRPALGSIEAQEQGKNLVILGSVMQSIGVGLGIADTISGGFLAIPRTAYSLGTIPFAPLTIHGFELMLSDGSEISRLRAQASGYFEAAGYSGLIALLSLTPFLVGTEQDIAGSLFHIFTAVPHAITAAAMLIPAFVVTARADHKQKMAKLGFKTHRSRSPDSLFVLAPMIRPGGGGLHLVGTF